MQLLGKFKRNIIAGSCNGYKLKVLKQTFAAKPGGGSYREKAKWKLQKWRKKEACESLASGPVRWNMEVFALAALAKTSDTRPTHPHSSSFQTPGLLRPPRVPPLTRLFPSKPSNMLSKSGVPSSSFFFAFHLSQPNRTNVKKWGSYKQNSTACLHQQLQRNIMLNEELTRAKLDGSYLALTAHHNLIYSLGFYSLHIGRKP